MDQNYAMDADDLRRVTQRSERKLKGLAQCRGSADYDICKVTKCRVQGRL
jgi:hypothetical protein